MKKKKTETFTEQFDREWKEAEEYTLVRDKIIKVHKQGARSIPNVGISKYSLRLLEVQGFEITKQLIKWTEV